MSSQAAHAGAEGVGRRQHVRQVAVRVGTGLEVEEDRAREAGRLVVGPAVAAVQMPACVDETEIGLAQTGGEISGGDQRREIGHGRCLADGAQARESPSWITSVRAERNPASQ